MHRTRRGKINIICAARAAIKKEEEEQLRRHLTGHTDFSFILMQGRTRDIRKKSQGPRIVVLCSLDLPRTGKTVDVEQRRDSSAPLFAIKYRGAAQLRG